MRVAVVIFLLLCFTWQPVNGKVLGVQRALVSHYDSAEASGKFRCIDGSKTIPFSAVNDDVCECPDGSDEPGTSACAMLRKGVVTQLSKNWQFQCTNEGFFEQQIPHSHVNDGICDCCDGSDELASGVPCVNRCGEVESELARQKQEERKMLQKAAVIKAAMRAEVKKHHDELANALPAQKAEREAILAELPALEEKNKELQTALELVREQLRAKYVEWEATKGDREAAEEESCCIKWRQTGNCKADGPREAAEDKDCETIIRGVSSGFCECAPASPEDESKDDTDVAAGSVEYRFACGHPDLTCMHVCDNNGEAAVDAAQKEPENPNSYTTPEATAAEEAVTSRRNRLAEVEKAIEEAEKVLNSTTPTTEELLRTLEGKTFTIDFRDHTFELTMFKEIFQRDRGATGGGPLIGKWKSFAENTYAMWAKDAYDLSQMIYDNGMRCWNGVYRKADIQLVCGSENKLTHIEEPIMCIYRMVFETPAMCDD
ncbi:putative mitochondrial glucosidase II beta subunit [Leptomonas pyrrhocoris]|uniref:Glucosidase 2 subunit beta n=1 Tax=Leptomonas pyrrhocoris TaxID=157538 RepID=A0A0M9GBF9_LEPPY|nr:putative mitochondrial glucosidase II beta subunit [Leptomonas pyrrhocoris]KPA86843.1 putative mitochondrial glucosidase II beta subunit [Leptomonas pyrrhocoris]|eukprot:XP_015665282.1 putative mitochondrial glucosidase II beta subunit [Leptomonas pyrrhocoris]